jgi:hypothetical protein
MSVVDAGGSVLSGPITLPTDRVPTEHEEQREFVKWFRQRHPKVRIFAIPNGGARGKAAAARLKLEGVSPGVPDLFVPAWLLWIEMKRSTGGVRSDKQKDWIAYLEEIGHRVIVPKGAQDAKDMIEILEKNK